MNEANQQPVKPVPPPAQRSRRSKLLPLFVAVALGVPGGFITARMVNIPLVETLDNYRPGVITRLYSRSGQVFAEYAIQRRIVVAKKDMAPALIQAVIATEDSNFFRHGGIDPKAIIRAGIKDLIAMKKVEGASTLTQQLARQVFLKPEKSFRRKINEAFLAIEIEKDFTKDQILELYLNQMYLGHGAYGVEAASRLYFGKHANELTLSESAVIAGMFQLPNYYSPIRNPKPTINRRNHVLGRMLERKFISADQYRTALAAPLILGTYREETPGIGAYFAEQVRQHIEGNYGVEDLYKNGLEVSTTLDLPLQAVAELAVQRGLRRFDKKRGFRKPARNLVRERLDPETYRDAAWSKAPVAEKLYPAIVMEVQPRSVEVRLDAQRIRLTPSSWAWTRKPSLTGSLKRGDIVQVRFAVDPKTAAKQWFLEQLPLVQGAMVVIDVKSGEVRALVGGYDFNTSKFNRAVQSLRQTGSVFKPFVYGAAFEKGLTPGDTLFDSPISIRVGNAWYSPRNYYGKYAGIVTIQRALELSINVPAVKAYTMAGGDNVVDFSRRLGITSDLPRYPSLALGAAGVSPLEMTAAYNVFANQGVHIKPRLIKKITDQTQKVIEEGYPDLSEGTSAQIAYLMTHVLQGTIDRGTAFAAHTLPGAFAGKTGTTNGFTDAWFVGFSPELTVGVWMGYDNPSRSLGGGSTGGDVALPIWMDFFKEVDVRKLRGTPAKAFPVPPGIVILPMDLRTGRRGRGPCGKVIEEAFIAGTEPQRDCGGQGASVSKLPFYLQKPFYQPKETEPVQEAAGTPAQPGEGGESPAPPIDSESTPAPPAETPVPPAPRT